MTNRRDRFSLWLSIPASLLCLVWYSHVLLTEAGDPLGLPFDIALWLLGSGLKIATIVCIAPILARLLGSMAQSVRQTLMAGVLLIAAGWGLIMLASLTREVWAPVISNDAIKYYSFREGSPPGMGGHWAQWKVDWQAGIVTTAECGLVLALVSLIAIFGYFVGHRPILSVAATYVCVLVILITYNLTTHWSLSDYDEFHGDIFASALLRDHLIFFLANDPYTTLASLVYVDFAVVSLLILAINRRQMNGQNNLINLTVAT